MPLHDWTRVDAGIFHSFHNGWIGELTKVLNAGLLPPECYALAEQVAGGIGPDVISLRAPLTEGNGSPPQPACPKTVALSPPKVALSVRSEKETYARKRQTVVIRHLSGHQIIALIEVLSPGNKASRSAFQAFLDKACAALSRGIHLLVVDLFPPTKRDPNGIHGAIWEELTGGPHVQPIDKPLTCVSYSAGLERTAYIEPLAVGDSLPEMPLFLEPESYIDVPLEATCDAAYEGLPRYYRNILEG